MPNQYLFLDDGRRVDVTDGRVNVFPDDGFNFNESFYVGEMERVGTWWRLTRGGRDVGSAQSKKEAVLKLLEDASDDIAARERSKQQELEVYRRALAAIQQYLPAYRGGSGSGMFGTALVFSPEQMLDLIAAIEGADDDDEGEDDDESVVGPPPSYETLQALAAEHIGVTFEEEPEAVVRLAAIGITYGAWRNTHLEVLHAGDHPTGGFPDEDMMRFNVATTKLVSEYVGADGIDWTGLCGELTDPDRELPGGKRVGELAGEEFDQLAEDIDRNLGGGWAIEKEHGLAYALTRFALPAAMACKGWFGTPWWPEVADEFMAALDDPGSPAWKYDDRSKPEPVTVADRAALTQALLTAPDQLDDDTVWWCLADGLGHWATHRGYARWRQRRDPDWENPAPYLLG